MFYFNYIPFFIVCKAVRRKYRCMLADPMLFLLK